MYKSYGKKQRSKYGGKTKWDKATYKYSALPRPSGKKIDQIERDQHKLLIFTDGVTIRNMNEANNASVHLPFDYVKKLDVNRDNMRARMMEVERLLRAKFQELGQCAESMAFVEKLNAFPNRQFILFDERRAGFLFVWPMFDHTETKLISVSWNLKIMGFFQNDCGFVFPSKAIDSGIVHQSITGKTLFFLLEHIYVVRRAVWNEKVKHASNAILTGEAECQCALCYRLTESHHYVQTVDDEPYTSQQRANDFGKHCRTIYECENIWGQGTQPTKVTIVTVSPDSEKVKKERARKVELVKENAGRRLKVGNQEKITTFFPPESSSEPLDLSTSSSSPSLAQAPKKKKIHDLEEGEIIDDGDYEGDDDDIVVSVTRLLHFVILASVRFLFLSLSLSLFLSLYLALSLSL